MSLYSFGRSRLPCALPFRENQWPGILFFVILAGLGLWYGGKWTWQNYLFSAAAQHIEAKVVRKYLEASGQDGSSPHIEYRYLVNNLGFDCDRKVGRDAWNQVEEGGVVPIKYLADNPSDNRLDHTGEDFMAMFKGCATLAGGVAAIVFGVLCTLHVRRRMRLVEWLRTSGLTATARLIAVESETDGEGIRSASLRFEFIDNSGREIVGCSPPLTRAQERAWRLQSTITVFYDSADARIFTVNLG